MLLLLALLSASMAAQTHIGNGQVLILTGPPGSGKTVQSNKLAKKYKILAISVADVLKQSYHGQVPEHLKQAVASGELLDDRTAINLISARIAKPDAGRGFILDGYPISEDQAKVLDQFVKSHNLGRPIVIVLRAPDDVLRERLRKRGRADDTPANIDRRIKAIHDEEAFLERWYETQNTVRVDATGTPERVFQLIEEGIEKVYEKRALKTR